MTSICIKLLGTRNDKAKAFYEMITHGNTFSRVKDEFIVKEHILKRLDKKGLKYERLENGTN